MSRILDASWGRCLGLLLCLVWGSGAGCSSSSGGGDDASHEQMTDVADVSGAEVGDGVTDQRMGEDVPEDVQGADGVTLNPVSAAGLDRTLRDYLTFTGESGVSAAMLWGDTLWSGAAGIADIKTGQALKASDQLRVGSNSKPYLAVVVMQLVEEGKIDLDQPLTTYLPEYTQWSNVTVRHLIGMRSGIPEFGRSMLMWADVLKDMKAKIPPETTVGYVADDPFDFEPGSKCSYSNTNYVLLGMIVREVSGNEPWEEIDARIIQPLGLKDTFMDTGEADLTARGYFDPTLGAYHFGVDPALLSLFPKEYQVPTGEWLDATELITITMAYTAGSIVSTPVDGVRFVRALLKGELLKGESLAQMQQFGPCDILGEPVEYGLGMMRWQTKYGTAYGHGGRIYGYHANVYYVPEDDMAVCHLHNFLPAQGTPLGEEIMRQVHEEPRYEAECPYPEGFYEAEEPWLELRFRGVNGAVSVGNDVEAPDRPMIRVADHAGGKMVWRYGAYSGSPMDPEGKSIQIESLGPGATPKKLRRVFFRFNTDALPEAGESGIMSLQGMSASDVQLTLSDVDLDDAEQPKKRCVTAVWDGSKPSKMLACQPMSPMPQAGQPLRFHAVVAFTTDAAAIETATGGQKCECLVDGLWTACP